MNPLPFTHNCLSTLSLTHAHYSLLLTHAQSFCLSDTHLFTLKCVNLSKLSLTQSPLDADLSTLSLTHKRLHIHSLTHLVIHSTLSYVSYAHYGFYLHPFQHVIHNHLIIIH
jgi:hypothetical protein